MRPGSAERLLLLVAAAVAFAACGTPDAADPTLVADVDLDIADDTADVPAPDTADSDSIEPATCGADAQCEPFGKVCDPSSLACVACLVSDDCPSPTDLCVAKACQPRTPCQSDKACIGADLLCDTTAGVCVDCLVDSDCGEARVCRAGTCMNAPQTCTSSKDCSALGQVCDDGGHCVACASDLDCGEFEHCSETLCLPDRCHAGEHACADGATRRTCATNGSGWSVVACENGTTCDAGACVSKLCSAGAKHCDGAAIVTCNAQGTGWGPAEPCADGHGCLDGVCKAVVCQTGTKKCSDQGGIDSCAADGFAWTSAACPPSPDGKGQACDSAAGVVCKPLVCSPKAAYCQGEKAMQCDVLGFTSTEAADCSKPGPAGGSQTCLDGKCVVAKCQAGQKLCADPATLATCKADGSGWQKMTCSAEQGCEDGGCKAVICAPGGNTCSSSKVVQCSAAGTSQATVIDCATNGQVCDNGACHDPSCLAGTTQCQGEQLATCKTDGTGWVLSKCAADQTCFGAGCEAKVCTPGAVQCQTTAIVKCDTTGAAWSVVEDCATAGKLCVGGACVSQVCQPGNVTCVGGNIGTCKADGSGWVEQACGEGKVCDGGGCLAQVCPPGAPSCQAAKAYKCDAKGLQQEFVVDCAAGGKECAGGICVAPYCGDGKVNLPGEVCDDGNGKDGDGCSSGCKLEGPVFKGYAIWKMNSWTQTDEEMDALMDQACEKYGAARAATAAEIVARKIAGMPEKNLPDSGPDAFVVVTRCPDCLLFEDSGSKSGFTRRAAPIGKTYPTSLNYGFWAQVAPASVTPVRTMCVAP